MRESRRRRSRWRGRSTSCRRQPSEPAIDAAIAAVLSQRVWAAPPDRRARLVLSPAVRCVQACRGRRVADAAPIEQPWMADAVARIARDRGSARRRRARRRRVGRRAIRGGAVADAGVRRRRPAARGRRRIGEAAGRRERRAGVRPRHAGAAAIDRERASPPRPIFSRPRSCRLPMRRCSDGHVRPRRRRRRGSRRSIRTIVAGCGSRCSCLLALEMWIRRAAAARRPAPGRRRSDAPVSPDRPAPSTSSLDAIASAIRAPACWRWPRRLAGASPPRRSRRRRRARRRRRRASGAGARRRARRSSRALERAHPDARNLFVTADELARDTLTAKPPVRARVFADAAASARAAQSARRRSRSHGSLRVALLAALAWTWRRDRRICGAAQPSARRRRRCRDRHRRPPRPRVRVCSVDVAIQPPAYTGLKETTAVDPEQLQAIEGSALVLSIDASASRVSVEHDGRVARARARRRRPVRRPSAGHEDRLPAGDRRRRRAPHDPGRRVAGCAAGRAPDRAGARSRVRGRQPAHRVRRARDRRLRPALAGAALHEGHRLRRELRVQGRRDPADGEAGQRARLEPAARRGRSPSSI